jgi:hypothetical protein
MALIAGRFPETSTPAAGAGDDRARVESHAHAHDDGNTIAHDDVEGNKMVDLRVRGKSSPSSPSSSTSPPLEGKAGDHHC